MEGGATFGGGHVGVSRPGRGERVFAPTDRKRDKLDRGNTNRSTGDDGVSAPDDYRGCVVTLPPEGSKCVQDRQWVHALAR